MNNEEMADVLYERYVKPYAKNKTLQKMREIMEHELTCGDLSHGHGAIKVKWSKDHTAKSKSGDNNEQPKN